MLTGIQIRMALIGLRMTHEELANEAGVGEATVWRAAKPDGVPDVRASTLEKLQEAMERRGAIFLTKDDANRAGVKIPVPSSLAKKAQPE